MNTEEKQAIAKEGLSSATKGAAIAAASSIATGAAITSTPAVMGFWGLWVAAPPTIAIAGPVVVTAGVIGAVTFGAIAGYRKYKKIQAINKMMGD